MTIDEQIETVELLLNTSTSDDKYDAVYNRGAKLLEHLRLSLKMLDETNPTFAKIEFKKNTDK